MSGITKIFFLFFIFLFTSLMAIAIDANIDRSDKQQSIKTFSSITKLPNTILSTSYFEPRIREYKDDRYKLYDGMKEINYMDFARK